MLSELPIAAKRSFFFIVFSSLLNGFLKPRSAVAISLSFRCATRRSSKLQKFYQFSIRNIMCTAGKFIQCCPAKLDLDEKFLFSFSNNDHRIILLKSTNKLVSHTLVTAKTKVSNSFFVKKKKKIIFFT